MQVAICFVRFTVIRSPGCVLRAFPSGVSLLEDTLTVEIVDTLGGFLESDHTAQVLRALYAFDDDPSDEAGVAQ